MQNIWNNKEKELEKTAPSDYLYTEVFKVLD
jgi:hypothetical protein